MCLRIKSDQNREKKSVIFIPCKVDTRFLLKRSYFLKNIILPYFKKSYLTEDLGTVYLLDSTWSKVPILWIRIRKTAKLLSIFTRPTRLIKQEIGCGNSAGGLRGTYGETTGSDLDVISLFEGAANAVGQQGQVGPGREEQERKGQGCIKFMQS